MKISIGFDADGVLFDTESFQLSEEVTSYMKRKFNLNIVNINGYGIKDVYGCDRNIEMKFWTRYVFKYSLRFKARTGVRETIQKLREQGNKVFIITSKACAAERNLRGFIVRALFEIGLKLNGIYVDGIEYCSLENSASDKKEACIRKNIKIIIEDKKENVELLSEKIFTLCMDTRNNQGVEGRNIFRVNDFNDVYAKIQSLIAEMYEQENIFRNCSRLNKDIKKKMNVSERKKYYSWMREYYSELPFSAKRVDSAEWRMRGVATIFSFFFKKRFSPIIYNKNNIPEKKGMIFVCNHLGNKDMLLLLYALHNKKEQWHPLIKKEILNEKVGKIFEMGYSVFVDRNEAKSRHLATQEMAKLLVNGYNVLIFPEGTYNKTESNLKEFTGVSHVYLSQILEVPIVHCALTNDYTTNPILRIGNPYIVSADDSIEDAVVASYRILYTLVEENKNSK